jgi:membrane-associated phospholipid phosphatase
MHHVFGGDEMQESILTFFQGIAGPGLDLMAELITMLGEEYFFILVISFVLWNVSKRTGFKLAFTFLFSTVINSVLKIAFHTPRPFEKLDFIEGKRIQTATGYSFPSGHTQSSTTFFTTLAVIIRKRIFSVFAVIIILLIGVSRVYLGVHWPVDVLGGWFFGILISLLFCKLVDDYYDKPSFKKLFLTIQISILILTVIIFMVDLLFLKGSLMLEDFFKISGVSCGAVFGFFWELDIVDFSPDSGSYAVKIIRFVLGLAGTMAIMIGVKMILPEAYLFDFIRYALTGLWITYLWPALGVKLGLFTKTL